MAALTRASDELAVWFPKAVTGLAGSIAFDPVAASRRIGADILPRLDAYLTTADNALAKADAYRARVKDASVQGALETIRRRTSAAHELRRTFARVQAQLAAGNLSPADLERIGAELSSAGMALVIAN